MKSKNYFVWCMVVMVCFYCIPLYAEEAATGTIPEYGGKLGDVNCDGCCTICDALMTAQYFVGLNPFGFRSEYADVNCDGSITIVDALIMAQYYVGLIKEFSLCLPDSYTANKKVFRIVFRNQKENILL